MVFCAALPLIKCSWRLKCNSWKTKLCLKSQHQKYTTQSENSTRKPASVVPSPFVSEPSVQRVSNHLSNISFNCKHGRLRKLQIDQCISSILFCPPCGWNLFPSLCISHLVLFGSSFTFQPFKFLRFHLYVSAITFYLVSNFMYQPSSSIWFLLYLTS